MVSRSAAILILIAAPALVPAGTAGADPPALVVEPRGEVFEGLTPGVEFPGELVIRGPGETVVLRALGSGVRRQLMFKVYEGALYAEAGADLGDSPWNPLIRGDLVRHLTLKFLRDVTGDKVRDAIEEGFAKVLQDPDPSLLEGRDRLLGYFEGGISGGETIELTFWPGKGLYTRVGRTWHEPIRNDELIRAVMEIWLGSRPVSEDLRRDLVRLVLEP